jgi:hypothetical protein
MLLEFDPNAQLELEEATSYYSLPSVKLHTKARIIDE